MVYNLDMRSLRQFLIDTEPALLRVIASRWDMPPSPASKTRDIAGAVAAWLADPEHAPVIVERLAAPECEALRVLIAGGGSVGASAFARRFGSIRPVGPARLERDQPWRAPISPAEGLWYLGLIYRSFEERSGGMQDVIVAPPELHPLAALLAAPELPADTLPPAAAPASPSSSAAQLADDLCTLLAHLLDPYEPAWTRQLRDADPDRLALLERLAQRARLVRPDRRKLDPAPALAWLGAPTLDQLRGLFIAWSGDEAWNDLEHVSALKIEAGAWRNDPLAPRRAILAHLRAALPESWHTLDSLAARIKRQQPDFARPEFDTGYIRDTRSGDYLHGFDAWDRVEGELIRHVLTRPLFWMGIVDLGGDLFKVTPIGAAILGLIDAPPPGLAEPASHYVVRADATVSVLASRRLERFQLARVADFVSAGDVYTYRLTPASLARARRQKIDASRIIDSLRRASQAEAPPSVVRAVQRWSSKGREAKIGRAIVLQVKSQAILKTIQASAKTRSLVGESLGPTALKVPEKNWRKLVSALAELGLLVDTETD